MRQGIICFSLTLLILLLCSCSLKSEIENREDIGLLGGPRTEMLNKEDDGKIAAARLEQILEAIKIQDKDAIKKMFSIQAQEEADDLDGGIDYLYTLIKGDVERWEKIGGSVDESINDGDTIKMIRYRFNVYTDKEEYLFSILEYTKDTENPQNIGLYCLKVINVNDKEPKFSEAGIYKP